MNIPIVYKAVKSISAGEAFTMNYEGDYIVSPRLEITALRWRDVQTVHDQSFPQQHA
jgi:hypothetical protein